MCIRPALNGKLFFCIYVVKSERDKTRLKLKPKIQFHPGCTNEWPAFHAHTCKPSAYKYILINAIKKLCFNANGKQMHSHSAAYTQAFCVCIKLFIMLAFVETAQCTQFECEQIFHALWDALSTMSNREIVEYFIVIISAISMTRKTIRHTCIDVQNIQIYIKCCHTCTALSSIANRSV